MIHDVNREVGALMSTASIARYVGLSRELYLDRLNQRARESAICEYGTKEEAPINFPALTGPTTSGLRAGIPIRGYITVYNRKGGRRFNVCGDPL